MNVRSKLRTQYFGRSGVRQRENSHVVSTVGSNCQQFFLSLTYVVLLSRSTRKIRHTTGLLCDISYITVKETQVLFCVTSTVFLPLEIRLHFQAYLYLIVIYVTRYTAACVTRVLLFPE